MFCSTECHEAERQEELDARVLSRLKPCERCNAQFLPPNSESKYCSRDCANRAHSALMLGENNPRWKDGAFKQRTKPHVVRRYREMRPLILKRDGSRCVECGETERLEVHHLDENPLNNTAANLVTVCRPCHEKVHFSPEGAAMSLRLKTHAEMPLSTTSKWKKPKTSSPTASSSTTAS